MGHAVLGERLGGWRKYELDDSLYLPIGSVPSLEAIANVFAVMRKRLFEGQQYLLGIEQVRDVIEALQRQLGQPSPSHRGRDASDSVALSNRRPLRRLACAEPYPGVPARSALTERDANWFRYAVVSAWPRLRRWRRRRARLRE